MGSKATEVAAVDSLLGCNVTEAVGASSAAGAASYLPGSRLCP